MDGGNEKFVRALQGVVMSKVERCVTTSVYISAHCDNGGIVDERIPEVVKPHGGDWKLVSMAACSRDACSYRLFWTWEREDIDQR